jgi:putative transposase
MLKEFLRMSPPKFQPFDPDGELTVYYGNLPHWRQPGATYFVTMRQADSLPENVVNDIVEQREKWLRSYGIDPNIRFESPSEFARAYGGIPKFQRMTFERKLGRLVDLHLDQCHGQCVLAYQEASQLVEESLRHFDGVRLYLGDFTVMPNHVHAIIQPLPGFELESLLGSIKKYSSRRIREWYRKEWLGPREQLPDDLGYWQKESYDRIVRDEFELVATRRYIAENPARAKRHPTQCRNYAAAWLDDDEMPRGSVLPNGEFGDSPESAKSLRLPYP